MRTTRLTIDLDAVCHNAHLTQASLGARALCAVVKANAYGHGALPVAQALCQSGVGQLAVALVEEAEVLRQGQVHCPIWVLGGDYRGAYDDLVRLKLTPMVGQMDEVVGLEQAARAQGVRQDLQLELDSGMARLGAKPEEIAALSTAVAQAPHLRLTGIMTHLTHADVPDHPWIQTQIDALDRAYAQVQGQHPGPLLRHIVSSGALVTARQAPNAVVRCGLSLYGVQPVVGRPLPGLRPVMRWTTRPLRLQVLAAGQSVSYGARWTAKRPSIIATLPVGYADGYPRLLGNRGQVLVRGQRAPVVGAVCMDLCMVDVTDVAGVCRDDEVVLLGSQGTDVLDAHALAQWAETIAWEIIARIGPRVPRDYLAATVPPTAQEVPCR